jgi:hypothetical protein
MAARCDTSKVEVAANRAKSGALAGIDYSPFIDSLFDGLPIKNCLYRAHLLDNSDTGVMPASAA